MQGAPERARDALSAAPTDDPKTAIRRPARAISEEGVTVGPVTGALATFLADGERSVWLTTAKLFVRAARTDPGAVEAALPALRDRLADDEFYFVRARSAEALGLVALEDPDAVTTPDVIAELLLGLEFDEPGVKAKLAKALEHVAVGDPERLTHKMANRAAHLDDEVDVVTGDD